jgi:hypothetical protein
LNSEQRERGKLWPVIWRVWQYNILKLLLPWFVQKMWNKNQSGSTVMFCLSGLGGNNSNFTPQTPFPLPSI